MCLAQNQPTTGMMIAARPYQAQKPVNGMRIRNSTASAPTATSSVVARAPARLSSRLAMVVRSVNTSSHTRKPGRKSTPQITVIAESQLSRSRRMRWAARQCSTTTWGSMPKDWMTGLRPAPSMRSMIARENASPNRGRKIFAQGRGGVTFDWCHSLSAFRILETSSSRYAAAASA